MEQEIITDILFGTVSGMAGGIMIGLILGFVILSLSEAR